MKTPYSYVLSAQGKWHRITQEINYLTFEVVCGRRFEAGTVTCMSAQQLRARASEPICQHCNGKDGGNGRS